MHEFETRWKLCNSSLQQENERIARRHRDGTRAQPRRSEREWKLHKKMLRTFTLSMWIQLHRSGMVVVAHLFFLIHFHFLIVSFASHFILSFTTSRPSVVFSLSLVFRAHCKLITRPRLRRNIEVFLIFFSLQINSPWKFTSENAFLLWYSGECSLKSSFVDLLLQSQKRDDDGILIKKSVSSWLVRYTLNI